MFKYRKRKKELFIGLGIGVAILMIILGAFFVLRNVVDIDNIVNSLMTKEQIAADTFIFVAIYITFINSFLEEFFLEAQYFLI